MQSENNPNTAATEIVVNKLVTDTLDKIIEGAKTASDAIGTTGDGFIDNVANQGIGGAADDVDGLVKGIKSIVDVGLKDVGSAEAGTDKKASDVSTARTNAAKTNAKDGTISGGIALTAMAKGGKFANGNDADAKKAIADAAISVVNKTSDTLTIAISNTIDRGLREVKDSMNFNSTDTTLITDKQVPKTKS